jgi:hypothetical protein
MVNSLSHNVNNSAQFLHSDGTRLADTKADRRAKMPGSDEMDFSFEILSALRTSYGLTTPGDSRVFWRG